MACILHIETATDVCSVALSEDGAVLFSKEDFNGPQHAVTLGVFVDEVLSSEGGKIYQTIVAEYAGKPYVIDDVTAELGLFAKEKKDESLRAPFIMHRIEVLSAAAAGKEKAGVDTGAERRYIERLRACL